MKIIIHTSSGAFFFIALQHVGRQGNNRQMGFMGGIYEKGATAHIQKSIDFEQTLKKIKNILDDWVKMYDK